MGDGDEGPVAAVALYFTGAELSHRDVLGALMAAGLKRETVGDILLSPGQGTLFVLRENLGYVLSNLDRAGRVRLRLEAIPAPRRHCRRKRRLWNAAPWPRSGRTASWPRRGA